MADFANVLADRYASPEMVSIWSAEGKIGLERSFWIAVMRAQQAAGVDISNEVIDAYVARIDDIDLESIRDRERVTRHDVKARIEEFSALAGHEAIHMGLTSRDLTENVEQVQIARSLELISDRVIAVLARIAALATTYADVAIAGRSHNAAAQVTTLGKRLATSGEELLVAHDRLSDLRARLPLRGLKGPVGTQQDLLDLLGTEHDVVDIDQHIAQELGFDRLFTSVGQVYPRSLDFDVVSALLQLASGPANLALSIRLMAGNELVTEGFREGQVGSSAMPHKMNTRSTERIGGFVTILRGHVTMAAGLVGDQWNEGDVSDSVVRRVVLPDAFFALDGVLETTLSVLDGFGVFPAMVEAELDRYLPFLATTKLLVGAVQRGVGREVAHEVIKEHAVACALERRELGAEARGLIDRLAADDRMPLAPEELASAMGDAGQLSGRAQSQVAVFVENVAGLVAERPEAANYQAGDIL